MNSLRYTRTAMTLHWLIALGIFIAFPLGLYMGDLKLSPMKLQLMSYHKWLGVSIFILVLIRLLWRASHRAPEALPMPRWQSLVSQATHLALYGLMIAIPLSGWLMSSAKGFTTVYFGVFPLPNLLEKSKELGDSLEELHAVLNYVLLVLVGLHIAGALKHHFIDRDSTMSRMLPKLRK